MTIKFNDFNNSYNNYNLVIGQNVSRDANKTEETKKAEKTNVDFKGLENETDLLTQNAASVLGIKITKYAVEDNNIADTTNEILASLGYEYKVSAPQVASVANGIKTVVEPGLKLAQDGAVAAHIQDPDGPFAELFV